MNEIRLFVSKPGFEGLEIVETAREESGAGDEQHRQRHLRDDEPLAEAAVMRGAGDVAGFLAQRAIELRLRCLAAPASMPNRMAVTSDEAAR